MNVRSALWISLSSLCVVPARAAEVPAITVGPALKEQAARLDAAIAEVTVFSDRARVRRRGQATLKGGVSAWRLPEVPGGVLLDTIRVEAEGARVLRVEAAPIERERAEIEQVKKLMDQLDALDDESANVAGQVQVAQADRELVDAVRPAAAVPEDKREGRPLLQPDGDSWFKSLAFLAQRRSAAQAEIRALENRQRQLGEKREKLQAEIQRLDQGGFSNRGVEVLAVLQATGGAGTTSATVELEYFVPGAHWKPVYDLAFDPAGGRLTLSTAAIVRQASGEDWNGVELRLSTAIPGQGIDLPELLTWTLGERRDFLPQPRPLQSSPPPPEVPPPTLRKSGRAAARQAEEDSVRARFGTVAGKVMGRSSRDEGRFAPGAARPEAPPPAMMAAPEPMPAAPSEMDDAISKPRSARVRSRAPAAVSADRASVVGGRSFAGESVPLDLFERSAQGAPRFSDPYLPAVSGGGLDYVYQAATRADLPSTGKEIRVPLAARSFSAQQSYAATPSLAPTAYMRARVRNDGAQPLLRGPANIFVGAEFVGQGEIATTGPGGDIEFPLGADQNIRVLRKVMPTTETRGLISKEEVTTYRTEIEIGNYKKLPIDIEIVDQVPKSRHPKIEIALQDASPKALAAPDADGLLRWRIKVAAGKTQTIRFSYTVSRPRQFRLYQQ